MLRSFSVTLFVCSLAVLVLGKPPLRVVPGLDFAVDPPREEPRSPPSSNSQDGKPPRPSPWLAVDPPVAQPPNPPRDQQCILGCKPGDVIKKTDINKINSSLDDLNKGWNKRKCRIGIANLGDKEFHNPRILAYKGQVDTMPRYDLPVQRTILLLFKDVNWPSIDSYGTKGLISYDIAGTNQKVVVLWYLPSKLKKGIKFNFGVFSQSQPTDKDMYNLLLATAKTANGELVQSAQNGVKMEAVMYGGEKSNLVVRVDTRPPTTTPPPTTPTTTTPTTTTTTTTRPPTSTTIPTSTTRTPTNPPDTTEIPNLV